MQSNSFPCVYKRLNTCRKVHFEETLLKQLKIQSDEKSVSYIVKASQKHNIWVDLWRDLWEVVNEESKMSIATPPYIFWASLKNTNVVSLELFFVSFKSVDNISKCWCVYIMMSKAADTQRLGWNEGPSISSIYFWKICIYPAPAYCHATLWSLTVCQLSESRS